MTITGGLGISYTSGAFSSREELRQSHDLVTGLYAFVGLLRILSGRDKEVEMDLYYFDRTGLDKSSAVIQEAYVSHSREGELEVALVLWDKRASCEKWDLDTWATANLMQFSGSEYVDELVGRTLCVYRKGIEKIQGLSYVQSESISTLQELRRVGREL